MNDLMKAFRAGWDSCNTSKTRGYVERHEAFAKYISKIDTSIRIIFLDIDGVLNNSMDSDVHIHDVEGEHYLHSPRCVGLLNDLIRQTNAKVVVSSTWRIGNTLEEMDYILKLIGVECDLIGMTDVLHHDTFRGNEILKWIKDNEDLVGNYYDFRNYVILDDDTDMLLWQKDNYVNCDPCVGLTEVTVSRAISILLNAPCTDAGQEFV